MRPAVALAHLVQAALACLNQRDQEMTETLVFGKQAHFFFDQLHHTKLALEGRNGLVHYYSS